MSAAIAAQSVRVDVTKRATRIPAACQSVLPASLDGQIDLPALTKELICKGAGDMMAEYTYVMQVNSRERDGKTKFKEESTTYEVFIPTLKSGMHARGILLVTSRNGVAVPPEELEKERLKTGERLEKEESKIAAQETTPAASSTTLNGMAPLGMYSRSSINRSSFGARTGGVTVSITDFLKTCELVLLKRESRDGREMLVLSFSPRPDSQFTANQKYMAQLAGEIWVDVTDRIVTRLSGWPRDQRQDGPAKVPAVMVEMMRLPEGTWLPRVVRINGLDYPTLFDHITSDRTSTYSQYIHFSTEIKDYQVSPPSNP